MCCLKYCYIRRDKNENVRNERFCLSKKKKMMKVLKVVILGVEKVGKSLLLD